LNEFDQELLAINEFNGYNDCNEITPISLPTEGTMATLTIRKLDSSIKESLRIQAAQHGISMEEEARRLLRKALIPDNRPNHLGSRIHRHFLQAGGVNENIIPQRSPPRKSPDFSGDQDR
jgi:plasmid stability protein